MFSGSMGYWKIQTIPRGLTYVVVLKKLSDTYFFLRAKNDYNQKKLDKIYVARDNKIKFKYFCILTRNQYIRGNHPQVHFIILLLNKRSFAYRAEQKNSFTKKVNVKMLTSRFSQQILRVLTTSKEVTIIQENYQKGVYSSLEI